MLIVAYRLFRHHRKSGMRRWRAIKRAVEAAMKP
jgi:hypothetical protein